MRERSCESSVDETARYGLCCVIDRVRLTVLLFCVGVIAGLRVCFIAVRMIQPLPYLCI